LANGLGNLASRTLTMIEKYFDGKIPPPSEEGVGGPESRVKTAALSAIARVPGLYEQFSFSRALETIWEVVSETDKYITLHKPWELAEKPEEKSKLANVLATAVESIRLITILAHPVIPVATQKIWEQMGQPGNVERQNSELAWIFVKPGTKIGKLSSVFPRVEKEEAIEKRRANQLHQRAQARVQAREQLRVRA
jgi:methionyl-tRNA synthetase